MYMYMFLDGTLVSYKTHIWLQKTRKRCSSNKKDINEGSDTLSEPTPQQAASNYSKKSVPEASVPLDNSSRTYMVSVDFVMYTHTTWCL